MSKLLAYCIQWFNVNPVKGYEAFDGAVMYKIQGDKIYDDGTPFIAYAMQPFSRAMQPKGWQWDGDRENPTLTPSIKVIGFELHVTVKKGKLTIEHDNTCDVSDYKLLSYDQMFNQT